MSLPFANCPYTRPCSWWQLIPTCWGVNMKCTPNWAVEQGSPRSVSLGPGASGLGMYWGALTMSLHTTKPDDARGLLSGLHRLQLHPHKGTGPPAAAGQAQGPPGCAPHLFMTRTLSLETEISFALVKKVLRLILLNSICSSNAQLRKDKASMSLSV